MTDNSSELENDTGPKTERKIDKFLTDCLHTEELYWTPLRRRHRHCVFFMVKTNIECQNTQFGTAIGMPIERRHIDSDEGSKANGVPFVAHDLKLATTLSAGLTRRRHVYRTKRQPDRSNKRVIMSDWSTVSFVRFLVLVCQWGHVFLAYLA